MEPIQVDFSKKGGKSSKEIYIPPEKAPLKIVISLVVTVIAGLVSYYFLLPAFNLKDTKFYGWIAVMLVAYVFMTALTSGVFTKPEYVPYVKRHSLVCMIVAAILGLILVVGYLVGAPLFRAKAYSRLLDIKDTETVDSAGDAVRNITFIDSISDFNKVPMIDAVAAEKLADKTLGTLASLGLESQFNIADSFSTQINYKNLPYRVFPLKYGDIFKWLKQTRNGFPGYVTVNMNTQQAEFVKTEQGIKYTVSEHFGKYLLRVVRFSYPTWLLGNQSFEIDEEGHPYWIVEHRDKTIGLLGGDDIIGIIVVDAYTGECVDYGLDEIKAGVGNDGRNLEWIDQVFDAPLLNNQYNYIGKYSNGFINYYIGQENVKLTTSGYNYLADGNDVYMYTGVTSANSDESILGFVIINQRSKDAYFYSVSGATEAAAQKSAQDIVSDKQWTATFPLLIMLRTNTGMYEPTYFMALKGAGAVVKSYSMVNVSQYSDAVRSPGDDDPDLKECLKAYINKLAVRSEPVVINIDMSGSINVPDDNKTDEPGDSSVVSGIISDIRSNVIAGTTYYYIRLAGSDTYYYVPASLTNEAVLLNVGDAVTLTVISADSAIIPASDVTVGEAAEQPAQADESTEDVDE